MALFSWICFLFLFENIYSEHQIIEADLGQTVTLSCLFDSDKIDQVNFSDRSSD